LEEFKVDIFDKIQSRYRSIPWGESGKRFGIIEYSDTNQELEILQLIEEDHFYQEKSDTQLYNSIGLKHK
jgi:hypothetical protein